MTWVTQEMINRVVVIMMRKHPMPREQAEDAVQDAILSLIKSPSAEEIRNPQNLLVQCSLFWYYKNIRSQQKEVLLDDYGWETIHHGLSAADLAKKFLGEDDREVLVALSEGNSMREVAEFFGLTQYRVAQIKKGWLDG